MTLFKEKLRNFILQVKYIITFIVKGKYAKKPVIFRSKSINKVNQLMRLLAEVDEKFNINIQVLKQKYHAESYKYNAEYEEFKQVKAKYDRGHLSEVEYGTALYKLKPYETAATEAATALETAEGYRNDEIRSLLDEIGTLADSYTDEAARNMESTAIQLQDAKKEYLKTIENISISHKNTLAIDGILRPLNRTVGIEYGGKYMSLLLQKTGFLPLHMQDLEINESEIGKVLKNTNTGRTLHNG